MPSILYLIDGHALAYRTYFALNASAQANSRWQTKAGEPTAGIYGFASVLMRILEQDHPEYMAVAFDTGKTFRNTLFEGYKATRAKMPDDLRPQIERIRSLVDAFNIPRLEVPGYEADDVLGSVATQQAAQGMGIKIITGDRDLLQLVNDRIIVNLAGNKLSEAKDYFAADVEAALGVKPGQVIDYKALVGDTSDNIPGVSGVGEKTAQSLLKEYANLDEIYAHLDLLPARVKTKLEAGKESAYLSRKLATIITDLPVRIDLEQARSERFEPQAVEALFKELEFRSLVPRLTALVSSYGLKPKGSQQISLFDTPAQETKPVITLVGPSPAKVTVIDSEETLQKLVETLDAASIISFDTETTSTDPMRAALVGISLAVKPGEGYYIPVGHHGATQLPVERVLDRLKGSMTDPNKKKMGHNVKYDYLMLKRYGLEVTPMTMDTMIAEWLIDPASRNLGLKNLAWVRLGVEMTHIEELIGKGKTQISMAEVPVETVASYSAADSEIPLRLLPLLEPELEHQNATRLLVDIEMPLVSVLADMEFRGIAIDKGFFQEMSGELSQRLDEIEAQIYAEAGTTFNINSTQQLSTILFERLGLEPPDRRKKTASGHFSTSADVLEELRGKHAVVDFILEYRELSKLKSTYLDALPEEVNPLTGRIHTSFNQTGSVTGRLASSDPNLQNIPTRTDLGRRVRQGFVADVGKVLLSVDYSQVELRIVASMAKDEAMLSAFRAGQDIHAATAAAIFGVPLQQVTKEQRRRAKAINFGLIYGMSAFGLSRSTDLTLGEAEDFVQAYYRQFPGVKSYLDDMRVKAANQGYVETLLGRRRYFPGLKEQTNMLVRNREEREAINAPIQGTAADIIKIAMLHLQPALDKAGLHSYLELQVHDELVLECPKNELRDTMKVVQGVMEGAYPLSIPLLTEAKWGTNWGEMAPMDTFID